MAREAHPSRSTPPGCPPFLLLGGFRRGAHQQVTSGASRGVSDFPVCHSPAWAQAAFLSGSGRSSFPRSEASGGEGFLLLRVLEGFASLCIPGTQSTLLERTFMELLFETLESSFIVRALINCAIAPGPLSS